LAGVVDANQAVNVANYVRSLSGLSYDPIKAARGEPTFKSVCAACHMATGKGNQALGAPNLTDRTWLYGSSEATIVETILKGRSNTMPAHENLLSPEKIRMLAAYVWGLSNTGAGARP
ncbi:MAG: c-type cytochrome, partial [Ralstonia mannitolilytica]